MGARWKHFDPVEQRHTQADDPERRDLERRVRAYADFGWAVTERQENPTRVLIRYPARRWGTLLREQDAGDRVIWVDVTGVVRVDRVGTDGGSV